MEKKRLVDAYKVRKALGTLSEFQQISDHAERDGYITSTYYILTMISLI